VKISSKNWSQVFPGIKASDIIIWHQGDINKWQTSFYNNITAHNNLQNVFLLCSSLACTERTIWVSKTTKERSQKLFLVIKIYDIIIWHQDDINTWPASFYIKSTTNDILQNMLLWTQVKAGTKRTFWAVTGTFSVCFISKLL